MQDLSKLIKAYDVRGLVPEEFDVDIAYRIGAAFARLVDATVAVVRDMRPTSESLAAAFIAGVTSQGQDVIDVGLGSTDMAYFAAGHLQVAGAMITASHNPAPYNGIKLCRPGAAPVGSDTGLGEIRAMLENGIPVHPGLEGAVTKHDLAHDYAAHLRRLVDLAGIRRLRVAADAGNGMGGYVAPIIFDGLPIDLEPIFFELDGTFPNHEANPLDLTTLVDLQRKVLETRADIGIAFDGDADRCVVVNEKGHPVPPSAIVALIATRELTKSPGSTIVYNAITSRAVPEIVIECGGKPARARVGHTFMKSRMAQEDAVFGGEHSGHYYFRDFWSADSGMLAALHILAALGTSDKKLSELVAEYTRYVVSGEINLEVVNIPAILDRVEQHYAARSDVESDRLDGLTVSLGLDVSWLNLRPANTEPLLRLNVEGPDEETVTRVRDEVLSLVK